MDITLAIVLGIIQLALAGLGIYVSLTPPPPAKHRRYIIAFILIGLAGIAVTGIQTYRNDTTQGSLQGQLKDLQKHVVSLEGTTQELAENFKKFASPKEVETKPLPSPPQETTKTEETTKSLQNIERDLAEVRKRIGSQTWGLSAEQLVRLARREAPYAQPEVERGDLIDCALGDPDSTKFAVNLVGAFRTAGWNLPGSGFNQSIFSGNPVGVLIKIHSQDADPPGLKEFVITLREAGIEPTGVIEASLPTDRFQIIIGHRPQT